MYLSVLSWKQKKWKLRMIFCGMIITTCDRSMEIIITAWNLNGEQLYYKRDGYTLYFFPWHKNQKFNIERKIAREISVFPGWHSVISSIQLPRKKKKEKKKRRRRRRRRKIVCDSIKKNHVGSVVLLSVSCQSLSTERPGKRTWSVQSEANGFPRWKQS